MESQHFYLNMYNKVSLERDRLSFQLKKMESRYDDTKKQLDKLKQDMRSSLVSPLLNLQLLTIWYLVIIYFHAPEEESKYGTQNLDDILLS